MRSDPTQTGVFMTNDQSIKQREEEKRDRAFDPVERWRQIQATITWAEANLPPELHRNRPRTHVSQIERKK
jgi:hypothetical protein